MVKNKKKIEREKKLVENIRRFIFEFGSTLLPLYIALSSFVIAYFGIIILYNSHRSAFLNYLNIYSGGSLIGDFFMIGFFIFTVWISFGLLALFLYKHFKRLESIGYKLKKKPLIQCAISISDEDILKFKKKKK